MAELLNLDAGRLDAHLKCIVVDTAAQALAPLGDIEVSEGRLGRRDLAFLDEVPSKREAAVLELERRKRPANYRLDAIVSGLRF